MSPDGKTYTFTLRDNVTFSDGSPFNASAAKTSADAVLLSNRLEALVQAFSLARRTRRVIIENLLWAALYNGLMLPFAALGWITPVWAAIGMSVSSLTVVLNALRLTRLPNQAPARPTADVRPSAA